jgi:hypothetical protein
MYYILITSNLVPKLGLLLLPISVYNWVPYPDITIGLIEARAKDYNNQDGMQFVNKGRNILASDRDFVYFPDFNKENKDLEIANKLRIKKISF